jgi:hypothetical protein
LNQRVSASEFQRKYLDNSGDEKTEKLDEIEEEKLD